MTIRFFASSTRSLTVAWFGFGMLISNFFESRRYWEQQSAIQINNETLYDSIKLKRKFNWEQRKLKMRELRLNQRTVRPLGCVCVLLDFLTFSVLVFSESLPLLKLTFFFSTAIISIYGYAIAIAIAMVTFPVNNFFAFFSFFVFYCLERLVTFTCIITVLLTCNLQKSVWFNHINLFFYKSDILCAQL